MLFSKLRPLAIALLLGTFTLSAVAGVAAEEGKKRPVRQTPPVTTSEVAKRMGLSGVVRLEVSVSSAGTVREIKVVGGHPLLAEDAKRAVKSWRWEPGKDEVIVLVIPFD